MALGILIGLGIIILLVDAQRNKDDSFLNKFKDKFVGDKDV